MKKMHYCFLLACCLFTTFSVAQKHAQADADNTFASGDYYKAIELYKKALVYISKQQHLKEKRKIKATVYFQIAECYRMLGDVKHEVEEYSKALKAKCADSVAAKGYLEAAEKQMPNYTGTSDTLIIYQKQVTADSFGIKK
jgi:tetratricopeptide (TPR) repeat protein